jgi:heptosyltransferase I
LPGLFITRADKAGVYQEKQHVIDGFFGFGEALGIDQHVLAWGIPIPYIAKIFAQQRTSSDKKL